MINQIVKGKTAGTFVIVGFFSRNVESYVYLKEINPVDFSNLTPVKIIVMPISEIIPDLGSK